MYTRSFSQFSYFARTHTHTNTHYSKRNVVQVLHLYRLPHVTFSKLCVCVCMFLELKWKKSHQKQRMLCNIFIAHQTHTHTRTLASTLQKKFNLLIFVLKTIKIWTKSSERTAADSSFSNCSHWNLLHPLSYARTHTRARIRVFTFRFNRFYYYSLILDHFISWFHSHSRSPHSLESEISLNDYFSSLVCVWEWLSSCQFCVLFFRS